MLRKSGFLRVWIAIVLLSLIGQVARAQRNEGRGERPRHFSGQQAPVIVNQSIDENKQASLPGNTRPEATPHNDGGAVPDNYFMDHMLLQLKRSAEQEQALQQYMQELQTKGSPNYQHWLSAQEFGERFGVSHIDIETLTRWMEKHGLTVNVVYPSGMVIDFSGTAKQVREAFHTDIHTLHVKGKNHVGNINDPKIPAALAPVVAGIVSLNDFAPHTMHEMRKSGSFTFSDPLGGTAYAVAPQDLATIYNLNPLFNAGNSGQGQTVVVIEDTDIFTKTDWTAFRSKFGLSKYTSGSFRTVYPAPVSGLNNCKKPGIIAPNDAEAILDAEWASAAAPSAAILMATCADTTVTFGGLIAIQNLINASSLPPAIMSVSYGQCEAENGAAANAAYNSAYQQAVAEGVSVFVAAGDSGAAGCDNSVAQATHGIGVNAFASTPYNVAVGGTDFSDTYSGTNGTYWNSSNTFNFGSARSYIPEIPWNDSCAGALFASYEGFNVTEGPNSFCNDPTFGSFVQSTVAGGGGPSACATGSPNVSGIVGGTCQGWPKPAWQAVAGNPHDGVRDTPDVSLFAADGLWSHYYIFCWSDTANGGATCSGDPSGWSGAGGTSFASPIMAGIQALVNQKTAARQGNPNPVYYQLAANEYNSSLGNACNSSNGANVPGNCVFYDVTQGDMDVNCVGSANCFLDGSPAGVLSTSNSSFQPAYPAGSGWDFATGIGSVNAANLVNSWPGTAANFTLSTTASSVSLTQGTSGTTTVIVTPWNGFNGSVSFAATGLPSGVTAAFNPSSSQSTTTLTLTASSTAAVGTATVTVTGTSGSLTNSTTISVSVNSQGSFTLSAGPATLTLVQGGSGTSTVTVVGQNGFNGSVSLAATGLPSGVSASFSPSSATSSSTLTLTASNAAQTGNFSITITGNSGSLTNTVVVSLTVNVAPSFALSVSPSSVSLSQGSSAAAGVTVAGQPGFSGTVALSASGVPAGVTASFSPASTSSTSTLTLTASSTAATGIYVVTITGVSGSFTKTATLTVSLTAPPLLSTWLDQDIGTVGVAGSASYANGTFTVNGAGTSAWGSADGINLLYQPISGDGTIVARVLSVSAASTGGVMIRDSLNANALSIFVAYYNSSIYSNYRTATGGQTSQANSGTVALPYWVKVVRSGSLFSSYASLDGVNWAKIAPDQTMSMGQTVYVGMGVSSGNTSSLATATFDSVSVNFASVVAPAISTVSATTGTVGNPVVISGTGFGAAQGSSTVTINGSVATINSWSNNTITTSVPSGATSGPLVVSVAPSMNASNPVTFTVTSQPLPAGWLDQDIGQVGIAGTATYANGTFTVNGAGTSLWSSADGFHLAYQPLSGDGTVVARVTSVSPASTGGVIIRDSLNANAMSIFVAYYNSSIYSNYRTNTGGQTSQTNSGNLSLPFWVKVVRSGNALSGFSSPDGVNWSPVGPSQTINMGQNVYVGLGTSSGSESTLATATFDNVSVSTPTSANFTLSASPASLNVAQGSSGTTVITVTPQNGFNGTVGLSATGLPNGVSALFSPSSTSSSSTLTLTASSSAAIGSGVVTVTGTSGALTSVTTIGVTVVAPPSFTLSASPSSLSVVQGTNGTATINIAGQNGFSGAVNLSASSLPAGVTASFNPASATSSSTLTLTASGSATPGSATVVVTGTSGSLNATTSVALTVAAAPSFTLSALPGSVSVVQGTSGSSTININGQNGFSGAVNLSASGLPAGVTATFSPASASTSSSLTLTASSNAVPGSAVVTITGASGSLTATTSVALTITAAPSFTLSAAPSSVSVTQGTSGSTTINVNGQNGFSSAVNLSASGLPAGVTASFNPASATGSSTLTLAASSSATAGSSTVVVTGMSGSLTATTSVALTVTIAPSFTLSASPSSVSVVQGASGTTTINVAGQNGFSGAVDLSASGLPAGVTATFNPASTSSSSTLTLAASSVAAIGSATVTITGTSGGLSTTTPVSLTVSLAPSFTLSASPSGMSIAQGTSGTSTISIIGQNGFGGAVNFSATGLPAGVTAAFNPASSSSSSTLTLTASGTAALGTVPVTVTGVSGSLTNSITVNLSVSPAWTDADLGFVGIAGSGSYSNGTFTVSGAGTSAWSTADGINFMSQPMSGDGTIVARLTSVSALSTGGLMIRDSLNASAMSIFTAYYNSGVYYNYRTFTGGSTSQTTGGSASLPVWLKLVRSGSTLSSYSSLDGVNWAQFGSSVTIGLGQNVYVGMAVSSGSTSSLATATFDSVSVNSATTPAPVISSVSATTGAIGGQVVISGMGFGASQGSGMVLLNGAQATISAWSDTTITITIPAGATSGPLVVLPAPGTNASNPVTFTVTAQPLPAGWLDQDSGQVGIAGSSSYSNGTFTVKGAGTSLWSTADGFHFAYQPLSGDGTIVARVVSVSASSTGGVDIRDSLDASAMNMFVAYFSSSMYANYRTSTGGVTNQAAGGSGALPHWVKVVRSGNLVSGYTSVDGSTWVQVGASQTISMGQNIYVGLGVSSGSTSSLATATFDNVAVTTP